MNCTIVKPARTGSIKAIPSKSAAHRWLIAAALSGLDITEYASGISKDIDATKACLNVIGAAEGKVQLEPEESGSTLRFLVPVAAALGIDADFHCKGRLADRPMEIMKNLLEDHGCTMTPQGSNPIEIRGKLTSGEYSLPGNVSSQYVTGLLFALPLLEGDSIIRIEGELQSRPYVDMTLEVLESAGIEIEEKDNCFYVKGAQGYALKKLPEIEGDWSNGAFWLVLDAVQKMRAMFGHIEVTGLRSASVQGDREIKRIIREAMKPGVLVIDAGDIPDLVPILSILASARTIGCKTYIVNAERLRYKESDRLDAVTDVIRTIGGNIEDLQDGLIIEGVEAFKGGVVDSYSDHRIAMMAAVAAIMSKAPITIERAEAVNKSYPSFFEDYVSLGGVVEIAE